MFGSFTLCPEMADSSMDSSEILPAIFPLEILHAEVHNSVVEILASQMRVTGRRLHLKGAVLDSEERNVKSAAPQ